jgi:1,4-alpha-glucan branching enzyme
MKISRNVIQIWLLGTGLLTLPMVDVAQSSRPGWGATPYHDSLGTGVVFRVWAPNATSASVPGQFNGWSTSATPLSKELTNGIWNGVWSANVTGVTTGSQYKYFFNGNLWKQDPRARLDSQPGSASGANCIVYDPSAFDWTGDSFIPPTLNDLCIYEMHIGTFYTNGVSDFLAATNKLDYLVKLGVNAVEVMPIAEFPGNNDWGYDLVQPFAVENTSYGGPDGFKAFVRACHARGVAVLLDVVHNHYGTTDLDMWNFDGYSGGGPLGGGIYFYESNTNLQITPWGDTRPNFSSNQVRNFVQDNFAMWLNEYHVDGFRWDAPYNMMHGNDGSYIPDAGNLTTNINAMIHTSYTGKISIAENVFDSFGFDSTWDIGFPYVVTPVLVNAVDANRDMTVIANAVQNTVSYGGGQAGSNRVVFLESHDVVGDLNGGVRLATAIDTNTPNSYWARKRSTLGAAVIFTAPGVPMLFQGQEMLENRQFSSSRPVDWNKTNTYSYIVQLYRDLISARRDLKGYTPGLEGDQCSMLQVDNVNKLVAYHRWKSVAPNQDVVVIANFANMTYNNYTLDFPSVGTWYVHFNSDSTNYGSDYGNIGNSFVNASGNPATASVAIGPYSAIILSQTPDNPPQLKIMVANGAVYVTWPNTYSEWVLEASPTVPKSPSSWNVVSAAQYHTNASSVFISTAIPSGTTYYRLMKP